MNVLIFINKKINAHALFFSILLSTIIAIIISSLFLVAHYYSLLTADTNNKSRLVHNLLSIEALALSSEEQELKMSLFDEENNLVGFNKDTWGIFETVSSWAVLKNDTLTSSYLLGKKETNNLALSISDQGRALKVSGKSQIKGNAYLPKSGVKSFLVRGTPYLGKQFLIGEKKTGTFDLTKYKNEVLSCWKTLDTKLIDSYSPDEQSNELFNPFSEQPFILSSISSSNTLKGNIIISSSSGLTIPSGATLEDVIIIAPYVIVSSGFEGNIQVFATDSIVLQANSSLTYPSSLNLLVKQKGIPRIELKQNAKLKGVITAFHLSKELNTPLIKIVSGAHVEGEIVSDGYLHLEGEIVGSVFCQSLIYNSGSIFYDHAIYNGVIDRLSRHKSYLGLCGEETNIIKKLN